MRRMIAVCLLTVLLLPAVLSGCGGSASSPLPAEPPRGYREIPGVTEGEIDEIERLKSEKGAFTYGHVLETESFRQEDGSFAGFAIKTCTLLSELFDTEFTPLFCEEFPALIEGMGDGSIDFTGCLTPTPERESLFVMSQPIGGRDLKMYTNAHTDEIQTAADLTGSAIGFLAGTVTKELVMGLYGNLAVEAVDVPSVQAAAEMLRDGGIKVFIIDGTADPQFEDYDFIQSRELFWPVFTQVSIATGDDRLSPFISVIDKYLAVGGAALLGELYDEGNREYEKYKLEQVLTGEEKAYLADLSARGATVKIALEHDNYPFSFYNTKEERFEGVVVDVLEQVSLITDIRFENTTTRSTPWIKITENLKTDQLSMVSHLVYSDERAKHYIWSTVPYSVDHYVLISKADFPAVKSHDIPKLKTGAFTGSIYEYIYRQWFPGSANLVLFESASEAFDALEAGMVDLVMGADFMLLAQSNYREKSGYMVNYRFDVSLESTFGYNQNEGILRDIIDKAMARIELAPISNYWNGRIFDYSEKIARQRMNFLIAFAVIVLLALLVMCFLFWKNNRLDKKLKNRAVRHEKIINTAQVAFLWTVNNTLREVNEYVRQHIGAEIGGDVRPFYADLSERDKMMAAVREQGTASNMILRFRMKNGEVHRFLASCSHIEYRQENAYLLWALDIEQDERIGDQLRATRRSLQTIMDAAPLPISILDRETGRMVYGNEVFLRMMDLSSPEELYQLRGVDTFAPVQGDGSSAGDLNNSLAAAEGQIVRELRLISAKQRTIDVRMHASMVDYNGKHSVIAIMTDLSEERAYRRVLMEAAEHEKEANRAKTLFLANMSHEIRTPMNGIIGMTELLLADKLSGRQLQYVNDIKAASESLLGIINDILDLSKISEGKLALTPVDIDLGTLLKNIVSMLGFSARVKGLHFIDDIRIPPPQYVRIDDVRFKQIAVNLLSNAIKFTKEGHVRFTARETEGRIVLEISDTGIGIKPENISQIFAAFEQVDTLKNRAIKGTGLGLSITKNLVELMGGDIRVESEYGVGTTFTVSLPFEPGDKAKAEAVDTQFRYLYAPRARVLLVDDIQTNLTVGAGLLRLCGINASVAASGQEAIGLIRAGDFDLVFMDHMMPGMDGVETMRQIRAMGKAYESLPIIALTANAMNESKELLISAGMNDFLSKPIDKNALMDILKKWLPAHMLEAGTAPEGHGEAAAYSAVLDAAAKLPGLNLEHALSRMGGLQDVLETSLRQTVLSVDDTLRRMDGYLSRREPDGFAAEAHGLKGALAGVGAVRLAELSSELEMAAKAEDMELCMEKFSGFAGELEGLAAALKQIFGQQDRQIRPPGDPYVLRKKAEEAIALLEEFEAADALACLRALEPYSFGAKADSILRSAVEKAESFLYEEAVQVLKELPSSG